MFDPDVFDGAIFDTGSDEIAGTWTMEGDALMFTPPTTWADALQTVTDWAGKQGSGSWTIRRDV